MLCKKILGFSKEMYLYEIDSQCNFNHGFRKPKMSDLEVIALAFAAVSACANCLNGLRNLKAC